MKRKQTRSLFVLLLAILMLLMSSCDGFMIVPITTGTQTESGEVEKTPETDEFGSELPTEEFDTSLPTLEDAESGSKPEDAPTKEPEKTTARPNDPSIPGKTTEENEDGTTTPGGEVTKAPEGTTAGETPTPGTPSYDFKGEELTVLLSQADIHRDEWGTEDQSDAFSSAIYQRNMFMEEKLNLCLVWECISGSYGSNDLVIRVEAHHMAGEDLYQVVSSYPRHNAILASKGYLVDLRDERLSALDLKSDNWNQSFSETASVGESLYMAVGRINTSAVRSANVVFFNQDLVGEYGLGNLYEDWSDGIWTVEKMREYICNSYQDLDGETGVTENDQFGLVGHYSRIVTAAGKGMNITLVERNEKGVYELNVDEQTMDAYDHLLELKDQLGVYLVNDISKPMEIFNTERALFFVDVFDRVVSLQNSSFQYGVLTFPKLNEEQKSYDVGTNPTHSVISVVKCTNESKNKYEMTAVGLNELNSNTEDCFSIYLTKYSVSNDMYQLCSRLMGMLRWDGSVLINTAVDSIVLSAFRQGNSLATQVHAQKELINDQFDQYFTSISEAKK